MSRHDEARATPMVQAARDAFHRDVIEEVKTAIARDPVVVVGMAWNPHVGKVRQALKAAGIEHTYLEYGNYLSGWKPRLAIKMFVGWPTFPMVFVRGTFIGGNKDTTAALADGTLRALLNA